jgi:SAM-dependent methyltransferase
VESITLRYQNAGNPALLDLIDIPAGRALDCGCGAGDNARLLRQRGWAVTGVTLDPAEARATGAQGAAAVLADLATGLPFGGRFDLVVLSHVLEHLVDPALLLGEAARVLAPGGRIAVALPNVLHYRQRAQFLRGRFEYTRTGPMDATHLRFFTVSSARRMVVQAGFDVRAARADGELPWWRLRGLIAPGVRAAADHWALARHPDLFAGQSLLLVTPTPLPSTPPTPPTPPAPARTPTTPVTASPAVAAGASPPSARRFVTLSC